MVCHNPNPFEQTGWQWFWAQKYYLDIREERICKMKANVIHSLTAYTCRICQKYHVEDLLVKSEKNEKPIELEGLLQDFSNI